MSLFALGLNHNTASLEKREKAYFSDNESKELLKEMLSLSFVEEAIILSTCNRTELYCELEDPEYMDELSKWVLDYKGLDKESYEELFYKLSDDKAVKHALNSLEYKKVESVRQGKVLEIGLNETSEEIATKSVREMCEKLLANTVIESYKIEIN